MKQKFMSLVTVTVVKNALQLTLRTGTFIFVKILLLTNNFELCRFALNQLITSCLALIISEKQNKIISQ